MKQPSLQASATDTSARERHASCLGATDPLVDVSIVIVNWNTRNLLHACLTSIRQNGGAARTEIIVVDNGSRDDSVSMVAREFPDVCLLANGRNMGYAAANNRGLSRARGRYLLLLNSDTVLLPGALEEMVRYMDSHPHCGALGPRLLNDDGSVQLSTHDFPRLDHDAVVLLEVKHWPLVGDLARRYAARTYGPDYLQTHEVAWVMGACLMLRREAIEQVGPLDDGYFFCFEEPDLCYRLQQRGWSRVFLASAEVIHRGGQSRARVAATSLVWYYNGLLRYYRLHRTRRRYLLVRAGVALGAAGHVLWRFLWPWQAPDSAQFLAAYARILAGVLTR